jgi:hypothetical protein
VTAQDRTGQVAVSQRDEALDGGWISSKPFLQFDKSGVGHSTNAQFPLILA